MPGNRVLPNYHYKIDIVINGSVKGKDGGVITTYKAYPFFSGGNLDKWNDHWNEDGTGDVKIDFDYEEK